MIENRRYMSPRVYIHGRIGGNIVPRGPCVEVISFAGFIANVVATFHETVVS
jgi:hypothetical protein